MSLSPSVRLPILVAMMIFLAAVGSTQAAMYFMAREVEQTTQTLGKVYLDGLTAAVLPYLRARDPSGAQAVLEQALLVQEGVVERQLIVLDRDGRVLAQAGRGQRDVFHTLPRAGRGRFTGADGSDGFFREVVHADSCIGIVAASLDLRLLSQERATLRLWLFAFDLGLGALCAALGYFVIERVQRPVSMLAEHLAGAARGAPTEIGAEDIPSGNPKAERMLHAYNSMVRAHSEREALLSQMAMQEREAVLGRLAATVAHEVRNPLAGMKTALGTLSRFGEDAETRQEAVEFLLRGVRALEGVVDATLASYRSRPAFRHLSRKDFEDLRLLVEADSRAQNVRIAFTLELPEYVSVSAFEVRQVVLNLLLNAVRACPPRGCVTLEALATQDGLRIVVGNELRGGERGLQPVLDQVASKTSPEGLGVSVVLRLVEHLNGSVSVASEPGKGTLVALSLPWHRAEDDEHEAS